MEPTYSIVIPVYKNEESLGTLLSNLEGVARQLNGVLEVVLVVDGSPDRSFAILRESLPQRSFASQLLLLSRNFGSFPAISAGMSVAKGEYIAVIAADLQEPPELPLRFFEELEKGDCQVVLGQREARADPLLSRIGSSAFWFLYRKLVQRETPPGGIDVFACSRRVRDMLATLQESNTSLVGLLLWIGFPRRSVSYRRRERPLGRSAWSLRRKLRYLKDSVFAFSDLPVRALGAIGMLGIAISVVLTLIVVPSRLMGWIEVPGYAALVTVVMFFGGLNSLGISLIGEYLWRAFENTKQRPRYVVFQAHEFERTRSNPVPAASQDD